MAKKKKHKVKLKPKQNLHSVNNPKWYPLIIFVLSFLLYVNTLGHGYTQDDPLVLTENMFTTQGINGIDGLLNNDTFYGFFREAGKDQLVAGGRYRPFTLIMFALEYEFFGANPFIGHLMNVILYGLLGMVIYFLLISLFRNVIAPDKIMLFSMVATLFYMFHPVHTEAVANIKGRDEIMTMLWASLAWLLLLKTDKKWFHYGLSGMVYFLALTSKENAITLVPLIGLSFWLLKHEDLKSSIIKTTPILIAAIIYLGIRFSILGNTLGNEPLEMMNNPFVKYEDGQYSFFTASERIATIVAGLGEYFRLLIFPHPLTNDYYPRQVGVMQWTDPSVIVSLLLYLGMTVLSIGTLIKKNFYGFGIIFFLVTISIFSNALFPIGTHLSERFLFMPSLGLAILIGLAIILLYYKKVPYVLPIFVLLIGLYGVKTISRNTVWKDNFTLFTTDVLTSNNSAKALNAAAGALTDASKSTNDEGKKQVMLSDAKKYLEKALKIHPNYKNAWLILANVYFYTGDSQKALDTYDTALTLDPNFRDAKNNKALVLRILGREAGEKEQNLAKAMNLFRESFLLNSEDIETIRLLGLGEGMMGNHENAIKYFQMFTQKTPNEYYGYVLLSQAYQNLGDLEKAQANRQKALSIDPQAFEK